MSFKDYYKNLSDKSPKVIMRDKLIGALGMKYSTFYHKMETGSFTKLEKEKISQVISLPVEELFPEKNQKTSEK